MYNIKTEGATSSGNFGTRWWEHICWKYKMEIDGNIGTNFC